VLPVLTNQIRDLTADFTRSARPHAPVRPQATAPAAARRSPGAARRALAAALRRSADRLAPAIE
jgi:hypothetical protein